MKDTYNLICIFSDRREEYAARYSSPPTRRDTLESIKEYIQMDEIDQITVSFR